jgi:hypothetical protein
VTDDSCDYSSYRTSGTRRTGQKKKINEMSVGDIIPEADTQGERSEQTNTEDGYAESKMSSLQ